MVASVQAKAIVLLDTDKRLVSLTAAGCPGVLLPVANRPILWYILKNIEKSGIASAILVRGNISLSTALRQVTS
jgi:NDP-sugar pyrophosphorylase family protein